VVGVNINAIYTVCARREVYNQIPSLVALGNWFALGSADFFDVLAKVLSVNLVLDFLKLHSKPSSQKDLGKTATLGSRGPGENVGITSEVAVFTPSHFTNYCILAGVSPGIAVFELKLLAVSN